MPTFEKGGGVLDEGDFGSSGMLITAIPRSESCGGSTGGRHYAGACGERFGRRFLTRLGLGHGSDAWPCLGSGDRAKILMARALLIEPEICRCVILSCAPGHHLNDKEAALECCARRSKTMVSGLVNHARSSYMDPLREDPRFKATARRRRYAVESRAKLN